MNTKLTTVPSAHAKRRLVVGCGALGMRVAKRWIAAGDRVWGTTRNRPETLASAGIEPLVADVGRGGLPAFPEVDTVFWAVGFDRTSGITPHDLHVGGLTRLLSAMPRAGRVILSSSTGVWSDGDADIVNEQTPANPCRPSAAALLAAEAALRSHPAGPGVALRLAGLYGPDRLPRLDDLKAGREIAADPGSWLNLIHLDDAATVVCCVADADTVAPLYVVSDGSPVLRGDWYARLATLNNYQEPRFVPPLPSGRGGNKRVDASLLFAQIRPPLQYRCALQALDCMLGRGTPAAKHAS